MEDMTADDRLQAVLYQFITLYERWAEDRQLATKQGADTAELVKVFSEQVKGFKELEPKVRQQLASSIRAAMGDAAQQVGEAVSKAATREAQQTIEKLTLVTNKAQRVLESYQQEFLHTHWKVIGASVLTTIATCFLIVWFLLPKPILPLTDQQLQDLQGGQLMRLVWPKLSKKEQDHWLILTNQIQNPKK